MAMLEPSSLMLFIQEYVQRQLLRLTIPASVYYPLDALFVMGFGLILYYARQKHMLATTVPHWSRQIALSLMIMSCIYLMLTAVIFFSDTQSISSGWMIIAYAGFAAAEIILIPSGLATIGILLPLGKGNLTMANWELTIGIGAILAGIFVNCAAPINTSLIQSFIHPFMMIAVGSCTLAILAWSLCAFSNNTQIKVK